MNLSDDYEAKHSLDPNAQPLPPPVVAPIARPEAAVLHRVAEVRREQGLSVRSAARRMGVSMEQVRTEEDPSFDLSLTALSRWQSALEVPIVDLLVEQDTPLSRPVLDRARLLRVMKTVRAIKESCTHASTVRQVDMLEQQMLEIMPELAEVSAWHSVGQRRTQEELGRIAERPISDSFAREGLS
ncbi:hypothetical protein Mal64_22420 [Pseudobythopirellula maris]|uniref:HTH cro/C1-type domain-containing protein n=1 Tax=Pseudobythopirellula maris TaxID=2527991 RepID=A0A5C5ZMP1_9BACT|nr:hypothetical protein [Pseudobythopirellula maris]TWT88754.1 hypothetical protein Mal64_22420 [Pseudobythopirellula maris]